MPEHLPIAERVLLDSGILTSHYYSPSDGYPSCWHTILASASLQKSSHTVDQVPDAQISTRPSKLLVPPTSLTWPAVVHG